MITNFLCSAYPVTGTNPIYLADFEARPGDIVTYVISPEAKASLPSGATLNAKIQVQTVQFNGFSLNAETSGVQKPWFDLAAADAGMGKLMLDGDFPSPIATDATAFPALGAQIRFRVPDLYVTSRLVLLPNIASGSIKLTATVGLTRARPLV